MKKRNIYLVQVDVLRKSPKFYTAYLPYSVATLWAYAKQEPAVSEGYELQDFVFLRDPIERVIDQMEDPFFVGFSCYCWNTEYNKALAASVKRAFPNCHILFGGHNVPGGGAMLEEFPYIDFLIHNEGEIPFQALLTELSKPQPDFTAVPGLSYRDGQEIITNPDAVALSVADFPSPYLEGVFDPLVAAHPEIQWCTVWETNRGCPYHCIYCDWGQHSAQVRQFPMEKLMAEIAWMSDHKVEYVWCADANFGILERDEALLDALIAARERTGFPYVFLSQTTKTLNDRLFRIVEKLIKSGLDSLGPNLAVQSLSPEVLKNIGRKNVDDETFLNWVRRYREAGYRTHSDLILGLPGETLQSFCAGVEKLLSLGQHEGILYFQCILLPNSSMADPAFLEKHKIRITKKTLKQTMEDTSDTAQIDEYVDMVYETATMPHADLLTATYFMLLTQGAHGYGILRLIALLFHTEKIVSYADFYLHLLSFYHERQATLPGKAVMQMEDYFNRSTQGENLEPLQIPGFSFGRMTEDQYFFGRAVLDFDQFYADTKPFLQQYDVDADLFDELLRYQREMILLPGDSEKTLDFAYDFPAYFAAIYNAAPIALQKKPIRLRLSTPYDVSTIEKYYEYIVFRGHFSDRAFFETEYL